MRAYFYCVPTEHAREVPYQHLVVALAEGLTALGVSCYANVDYWPLDVERTRFLLVRDERVDPDDCDIVIVSDDWFVTGLPFPERVTHGFRSACCVALDREDGARLHALTAPFRSFDLILRTHFNTATRYPGNLVPWAYGVTERVIAATRTQPEDPPRERRLLANWRHTKRPHSLRLAVERDLLPRLRPVVPIDTSRENIDAAPGEALQRLWWRETGRRHWPEYYARLRSSAACGCFGGYFVTPWPMAKESVVSRTLKRTLTAVRMRTHLVSQWDSWRFWESLVSGCAMLHVDLERYGCVLPEMPVNGVHYIGFDLDAPEATIERIRDDPALFARVGTAGRAWALEHYSPVATARRLLATVGIPYDAARTTPTSSSVARSADATA